MVRRILYALLSLAPIVILLHYVADLDPTVEFVLAATALIPLAWLIGEATEHAAEHTGPGIGGFLNATFGNAPELIIALIAVHEGLTEVVRGSLTGSVIGNLLLVLGFSLLAGGRGHTDRESSFLSFGLIAVATLLFLIVAVPGWDGDPDRSSLAHLTIPVSIALLVLYVAATWYSLRRHRRQHDSTGERPEPAAGRSVSRSSSSASRRSQQLLSPRCSSGRWRSSPRRRACPTSSSPQSSSRSSATRPSTAVP